MEKVLFRTTGPEVVSAFDLEGVGTLRWIGNKCFRWVQNRSAAIQYVGDPVCHAVANIGTNAFYETVLVPATADLGCFAGIVMGELAAYAAGTVGTAKTFGWIQVYGHNTHIHTNDAGTDLAALENMICVDGKHYMQRGAAVATASVYPTYATAGAGNDTGGVLAIAGIIHAL